MTTRPYIYGTNAAGGAGSSVSVVNGATLVTGGNAFGHFPDWTSVTFGDYLSCAGAMVPILEIIDATHLTLAYGWPGSTLNNQAYAITAGIDPTDARRYGWAVATYYQRLANLPADTQGFRDQAAASAAASAASATTSASGATLSQAWASTAENTDVPGATPGSRSALHWAGNSQGWATVATTNGAAQVTLAAAQVAIAAGWASTAFNTDVPGAAPGSRSALHYSTVSANNAAQATTNGAAQVTLAAAQVTIAAAWASTPFNTDVTTPGTRSALHWATVSSNSATAATANGAAQVTLAAAQVAIAAAWASAAHNADVTTPGTRSALHWSAEAQLTFNQTVAVYNQTLGVQTTINGYIGSAASYVQLAADWAQKSVGQDVNGPGTRSSYHWSTISQGYTTTAAASATAAAASAATAATYAALLANPDFGLIVDAVGSSYDWGTVP